MNSTHFKILKEEVKIGFSKIGGKPDLHSKTAYPVNENSFYQFVTQLNFEELKLKSELLPKKGILTLFVGSVSNNEYHYLFYSESTDNLIRSEIPNSILFSGKSDFKTTISGKIIVASENDNNDSIYIASKTASYKDPIFLKLIGYEELETNVIFDLQNNYKIKYFGRISGPCSLEKLLTSQEECFQLGELNWKEWKNKINRFNEQKDIFEKKFFDLICLISIPSNSDFGMIWGDYSRLEFFIMKEDLINKKFDKMIVKYAPD